MNCPRCNGWMDYSPEDDSDCCWNCGRLFPHFTPVDDVPKRRVQTHRTSTRSPREPQAHLRTEVPGWMAQLIIANGGTMRAAQLSELMQDMYGTGQRYVRLILANDHRFHTISFGLWGLTDQGRSDFENG